jgi:hypothetical protein
VIKGNALFWLAQRARRQGSGPRRLPLRLQNAYQTLRSRRMAVLRAQASCLERRRRAAVDSAGTHTT